MNVLKFAALPALKLKPYAIENKDGKILHVEEAILIRLLSQSLHTPYEILIPADQTYGIKLPSGNWTGMFGLLERSEVDLALGYIGLHKEIPKDINFCYPHVISDGTFMTNKPEPVQATKGSVSYPLSSEVWIAVALSLIVTSFFLYFLLKKKRAFSNIFFIMFGSLLEKSSDFKIHTSGQKILLFTWIIGMFVITSSYKGALLSFLTFPRMVGIRDISDLAKASVENTVNCFTYRGTFYSKKMIESNLESWKSIGKCMQRNDMTGIMEEYTMEEVFLRAEGKKAFLTGRVFLMPYEKGFYISKDSFKTSLYFIFYSKRFCCPEYLNSLIHRFYSVGLLEKYRREEAFFTELNAISRFTQPVKRGNVKKINFSDISGMFYFLIFGWFMGCFILLIEIATKKWFCSK